MRVLLSFLMFSFSPISYVMAAVDTSKDKIITSLANEPVGLGNYLQMFFGLFIIVALIIGVAWFMRRISSMNGMVTGNLKVLGGISVGQRERVVIVQAGETQLLIGVAPGEIRTLHVMDKPISTDIKPDANTSSGFAEKLHAAIKKRGDA